jgi:hypothetical protein
MNFIFFRFKNGKPIEQSPELRIQTKDGFGIITIAKTKPKDSGVYKCVASNGFNCIESEAKVTVFQIEEVEVKPTFTRITGNFNSIFLNLKKNNNIFSFR